MTGCYTDNQPDFTWIAPYETKTFTQYWYPVKKIGEPKCATREGACNLEKLADGKYRVGFYSTSNRKNCCITLLAGDKILFQTVADVSPENAFVQDVTCDEADAPMLVITDAENAEILSYKEPARGSKTPIEPRKPALPPKEIPSVEELYLNGIHLRQYKHFAYCPEDYFLEGLARDPGDIRCNKAMGDHYLAAGAWEKAIAHYDTAIKRLTLRNPNPYDTEPFYKRALCYFRLGNFHKAYDDAYAAVWSYPQRSAGYYLLAKLEARKGNANAAADFLRDSLRTNSDNIFALWLLGLLTGDENITETVTARDPLFFAGLQNQKNAIHLAIELMDFGCYKEARNILAQADDGAMKFYYFAELERRCGNTENAAEYLRLADASDWQCQFPCRTESISVLENVGTPMANYYLGCILYHLDRYADAAAAWEKTVAELEFGPVYRNLALGYFDHLNKKAEARTCLEKAHKLLPDSGRIFFELTQLYRSLNLPLEERLALYENNPDLTAKRDDCTLAYSVLCTVAGDYEKAKDILLAHQFHTYEGGEGNLTQHHAWLHFLTARRLAAAGEKEQAKKTLLDGLVFPKNYGEEKNYFVNEAHIYLSLFELEQDEKYLELANSTKGAPTVHSYYQCIALRKLGRTQEAADLAAKLKAIGENKIKNAAVNDYYGVGAPAYPPFGYDVAAAHTTDGMILCAFAALAEGDLDTAKKLEAALAERDASHFFLYLLRQELQAK